MEVRFQLHVAAAFFLLDRAPGTLYLDSRLSLEIGDQTNLLLLLSIKPVAWLLHSQGYYSISIKALQ
jgi:hypothetical protein